MVNILTFDMEDWFHILDLHEQQPSPLEWHTFPSRLESITGRILDFLDGRGVHATFFVLGWIAEKYPAIVRKIDSLGHEVACHGYGHELISGMTRDHFRDDLRRAKGVLEDATGKAVDGYRGPGFSITPENLWAFDIISEEGFNYDATLYPGVHGHGGIPGLPSEPFRMQTPDGHALDEFPVSVIAFGKFRVAFSGGGYFRMCPLPVMTRLISLHNEQGKPVMIYLHPRDLDPETPRLPMPFTRRFKCYVNVSGANDKLGRILDRHVFCSIRDWRTNHSIMLTRFLQTTAHSIGAPTSS